MKARKYSVNGSQTVNSTTASMLGLTSTTAIRPCIYDFAIGSAATPADNSIEWFWQRYTAAGTATAVTPQALDSGDPSSTASAAKTHTVEPTYTANAILWRLPLNQRASHRWIADPDGGLICPATGSNGLGLYPVHASATPGVSGFFHFAE